MLSLFGACGDDDGEPTPGPLDAGRLDAALPAEAGQDAGSVMDASAAGKRVELKFAAKFTSQGSLKCGGSYPGQGSTGSTVTPKDFRFYVQSVKLVTKAGAEVPLVFDDLSTGFQVSDVALIDFTADGGDCEGGPTASNTKITGTVPSGLEFNGVKVVIGVPESLNHADPSRAPAPLQAPGANWDWTAGYRFLIAEVLPAELPDAGAPHSLDAGSHDHGGGAGDAGAGHGSSQAGLGFVHLGSTGCTKEGTNYSCSRPNRAEFALTGFNPDTDYIMADLGAVFAKADLNGSVQCHGSGAPCAPMFEQLGVDLASGAPLGVQRVFSVSQTP